MAKILKDWPKLPVHFKEKDLLQNVGNRCWGSKKGIVAWHDTIV